MFTNTNYKSYLKLIVRPHVHRPITTKINFSRQRLNAASDVKFAVGGNEFQTLIIGSEKVFFPQASSAITVQIRIGSVVSHHRLHLYRLLAVPLTSGG